MNEAPAASSIGLSERYDPESDSPVSIHVVWLVAEVSDRDPTDLEPLGHSIDTDALNRLVDSNPSKSGDANVAVSFNYEGYRVNIGSNGIVSVPTEPQ